MQYKPRLDGLRAFAFVMVSLSHFLYFVGGSNAGIYGVNLFFVLSGFLITGILLNEKGNSFWSAYKRFIGRRALRIFPIYYLIILFFIIVGVDGISEDWPYLVTYTYNFRVSHMPNWEYFLYAPYWSLSVEEQFYVFFPLLVLLLNKRPKLQIGIFVCVVLLAFTERIFNFTTIHIYVNLVTNMGALALGAIGAWLMKYGYFKQKIFNSFFVEVVFFIALGIALKTQNTLIIFYAFPLLNLFLVIKASAFDFKLRIIDKILVHKWSLFIGKISYGLYLYHIMVQHFFTKYVVYPLWEKIPFESLGFFAKLEYNETLVKFPFTISLTVLIAYLSFRFIESPILKMKDKYFKPVPKSPHLENEQFNLQVLKETTERNA